MKRGIMIRRRQFVWFAHMGYVGGSDDPRTSATHGTDTFQHVNADALDRTTSFQEWSRKRDLAFGWWAGCGTFST